eukprot:scaffold159168_cov38-Prasinocladus_malaysianus.AAC.1
MWRLGTRKAQAAVYIRLHFYSYSYLHRGVSLVGVTSALLQFCLMLIGNPVQALIRTCLLEDRSAEKSFTYTPKDGAAYTLKWRLHNVSKFLPLAFAATDYQSRLELGLVFVAVYQRALSLLYVEDLLDSVLNAFVKEDVYSVHKYDYDSFNDTFRQLLLEAENRSMEQNKAPRPVKAVPQSGKKSTIVK